MQTGNEITSQAIGLEYLLNVLPMNLAISELETSSNFSNLLNC
jgi:hypothetical protein